jgi:ribonuclease Z
MKKLLGGLLVVAILLAVAWMARGPISLWITDRTLERTMAADLVEDLPDGLHAFVCGSGSPLPDPDRAGPCLAVVAGKRVFLVDAGEGAAETLSRGQLPAGRIEGVLLTHFHSDHIDGLGAVALQRWVGAPARTPMPLTGPQGVERVVAGLNEFYALDYGYRTAHHGAAVAPPEGAGFAARAIVFPEGQPQVVILDEGGLKITAFKVDHSPVENAVGYRFDYRGRSLVVTGDTAANPNVVTASRGADLLVHDALSPTLVARLQKASKAAGMDGRAKIMADIPDYHASPEDAARQAKAAGVKALLLTHIVPPLPLKGLEVPFLGDARKLFGGKLWIARDRDLISLPAGSDEIRRRRVGR